MDLIWTALSFGAGALVAVKFSKRKSQADLAKLNDLLNTSATQSFGLTNRIQTLEAEIEGLMEKQLQDDEETAKRRRYFDENDISKPENQLKFIAQTELKAKRPVNKEAVSVLYALDEWISTNHPDWRLSFEVGMGAFIQTSYGPEDRTSKAAFSSYNSKRVDFLLIDRYGSPMIVVEYNGTGHDLDGTADDRMHVKRLALSQAKIPLVEVPQKASKAEIWAMIDNVVASSCLGSAAN